MTIYTIVDSAEISSVDFSEVLESSQEHLRYSVDGTKAVLKYKGKTPSFLQGKPQYYHSEILPIMESADWTPVSED